MRDLKKVAVCECEFCNRKFDVDLDESDCVSNDVSKVKNYLNEHNIYYCSNCEAVCSILDVKSKIV